MEATKQQRKTIAATPENQASRNAEQPVYSVTARRIHWWTVGLVTLQIPLGLYMTYRGNELNLWDSTTNALYNSHKVVGLLILGLSLARLAYRWAHPAPPPEPTIAPWQEVASSASHWLLYALLIVVPIGGYIGISLLPALDILGIPFPGIMAPDRPSANRIFFWHAVGAVAIAIVVAIHATAAVYHYYMRRDGVLRRMLLKAGRY